MQNKTTMKYLYTTMSNVRNYKDGPRQISHVLPLQPGPDRMGPRKKRGDKGPLCHQ